VDVIEPFDWTPEMDLIKGLSPRTGAVLQYVQATRARAAARQRMFVSTVLNESALEADDLAERLQSDARLSALFETALDAAVRSADEAKLLLLARVVAQAAGETASVDDSALIAATVRELEPPHVRALVALAGGKGMLSLLQVKEIQARSGSVEGTYPTASSWALRCEMRISDEIADALSATLERLGLIANAEAASCSWEITQYGQRLLSHLRNIEPCF